MISCSNILFNIDSILDFFGVERVDVSKFSNFDETFIFIKCNCLRHKRSMLIDLGCLNVNVAVNDIQVFDSSKYDKLINVFKCYRVTRRSKFDV